jgi:hypothetical protein
MTGHLIAAAHHVHASSGGSGFLGVAAIGGFIYAMFMAGNTAGDNRTVMQRKKDRK